MDIDKDTLKKNLSHMDHWIRGLFMIVIIIAYNIAEMLFMASIVFQFLFTAVTGEPSNGVKDFCTHIRNYITECLDFLRYETEKKPFPFSELNGLSKFKD